MEPLTDPLRRFWRRSRRYYAAYGDGAAVRNLTTLWRCSLIFAAILFIYGFVFYFFFNNATLFMVYLISGAADLLFILFTLLYRRRERPSVGVVRGACILFIVLALAFTAGVSILPYPAVPSIFYPMVYLMVSVIFLLPMWQTVLTLTLTSAVYLFFAVMLETPLAYGQDVFATVTAWFLGLFLLYLVTDLRLSEGERRMELEHISTTDPLTGLPNRRWAEESLPVSYRRCQMAGLSVAAMMMDVDDFKSYNDSLGHLAGDACLTALGRVLREFSAEQGVYAARYGGEEFIFLLPGCSGPEAIDHAEVLLQRVRDLEPPGGCSFAASLGVAAEELPDSSSSYHDLIRKADAALYQAKAWGKNRTYLYRDATLSEPLHIREDL